MNELVLIKPLGSKLEPYTTTDIIAEFAGITHKAANQLAKRHEKDLLLFGQVEFEMEAVKANRGIKYRKIYHLNEQQATLFVTYLQNTPPVRAFKKRLVQEFFAMREELTRRSVLRQVGKPTQRSLTDAIRDSGEAERMKGLGDRLNSYTEISPSGSGLHVFCKGHLPGKARKTKFAELYERGRCFTVTGNPYGAPRPLRNAQPELEALYEAIAQKEEQPAAMRDKPTQQSLAPAALMGKDYLAIGLKNDIKFVSLWNGDLPHGNESADDQALMNKLAYWCNRDPSAMEAAFNASPHLLGKDPEHLKKASGADYIQRTIERAVKDCTETAAAHDEAHRQQLAQRRQRAEVARQQKKATLPPTLRGMEDELLSIGTMQRALDALGLLVRLNLMSNEIEITGLPDAYSGQNATEVLPTYLLDVLKAAELKGCTRETICNCVFAVADINRYNPVADMLANTAWDGVDRFPVIYEILGIEDKPRSQTYVKKRFIQCTAMAFNNEKRPYGADGALTLQGGQGLGKTTFFRVFAINPEWFVEGASIDTDNKDTLLKATSSWIVELGELDSTLKKERSALKSHITAAMDIIRAPYAKTATKGPRRTSYCGTVNPADFLRDETGSRRFWVVHVDKIDRDKLLSLSEEFILQVWAQSYAMLQWDPNSFRLSWEEIQQLNADNAQFARLLPFEQEVADRFDFALSREDWSWQTASDISTRVTGARGDAAKIGKVLQKMIEKGQLPECRMSHGRMLYFVPIKPYSDF